MHPAKLLSISPNTASRVQVKFPCGHRCRNNHCVQGQRRSGWGQACDRWSWMTVNGLRPPHSGRSQRSRGRAWTCAPYGTPGPLRLPLGKLARGRKWLPILTQANSEHGSAGPQTLLSRHLRAVQQFMQGNHDGHFAARRHGCCPDRQLG